MFIDPWGLESWIYYQDNNQKRAAEASRKQLLEMNPDIEVNLVYVQNAEDFIETWNSMDIDEEGNPVPIDYVIIHLHGKPDYIMGGNETKIYVDDLKQQKMDTILLTACDTGNMNYEKNVAAQIAMKMDVKQVVAPDGLGYFITPEAVKSEYFPDDGIQREGNGFVLYLNKGGKLILNPNLEKNDIFTSVKELINKGKSIGYFFRRFEINGTIELR